MTEQICLDKFELGLKEKVDQRLEQAAEFASASLSDVLFNSTLFKENYSFRI